MSRVDGILKHDKAVPMKCLQSCQKVWAAELFGLQLFIGELNEYHLGI